MSDTLEQTLAEVVAWARETFPRATPRSISTHLGREAAELYEHVLHGADDPRFTKEVIGAEMADCLMLLAHLADRCKVDLRAEVALKLEVNRQRRWGKADAEGVVEHVRTVAT